MAYTPSFKSLSSKSNFVTNNPGAVDMRSFPAKITDIDFNHITRSLEVTCDDRRMRQCRMDRLPEADATKLEKALIKAMNTGTTVVFYAAGGNNPNVFFYKIVDAK